MGPQRRTNIQPLVRNNVHIWTDWPLAATAASGARTSLKSNSNSALLKMTASRPLGVILGPSTESNGGDGSVETVVSMTRSRHSSRRFVPTRQVDACYSMPGT